MAEVGHDADALILRMAEINDDARVRNRWEAHGDVDKYFAPFGSARLDLDLGVDGQAVAAAGCHRFGPDDHDVLRESYRADVSRFGAAVRAPAVQSTAYRVLCNLHLWEGDLSAAVAIGHATGWGGKWSGHS